MRNLKDLTIWRYNSSAVHILDFYKQLLRWCDAQDVIRLSNLPIPADVVYPSRPDTVSNAPLPLDSVEQGTVLEDVAAAISNVQIVLKRNGYLASNSDNTKRSCVSNATASTGTHTPPDAAAKVSKLQKARKRNASSTRCSTGSKRSCVGNATASTSTHASAVVHPAPGELKLPPNMGWQKQAIATLTGTETNYSAFRAAVVAFMHCFYAGRRRP